MESLAFLTPQQVFAVKAEIGTPAFVYSLEELERAADCVVNMPRAFDYQPRYAMKACPTAQVVLALTQRGLDIDASSVFEAERAIRSGIQPSRIQITAQELPAGIGKLARKGVRFTACSLNQVRLLGEECPGAEITLRINPGLGSGHSNRTNVGGPSASFGIWHEYLGEARALAAKADLKITGLHTHIGSGADPAVWNKVAKMALALAEQVPEATMLSLGGGFKVGRMPGEITTDLNAIGEVIKADFEEFAARTGRRLKLEIEPGTFLVALSCALVATVIDVVDTGAGGRKFIKIDAGMTEILRPSMYGAQHPLTLVPAQGDGEARPEGEYVVVGHCCESGDILTPEPGNPEGLAPRRLPEPRIGDALVIGGAGAYCSGMAAKNYNSFPEAAEAMLLPDGSLEIIRRRQTLDQIVANEILAETRTPLRR